MMELQLGDVQTTALIPLAVKANETMRPNARIKDEKAVQIIKALNIDTSKYDKFLSHEGVIARTIMLDRQLKDILEQIRDFLNVLRDNFPMGGILIAEQNSKILQKNEKHHDTVKNTNARFMSGTDSAKEIEALTDGIHLVDEHSFNEEMKKYSIRAKIFALLLPKVNDRWATFEW